MKHHLIRGLRLLSLYWREIGIGLLLILVFLLFAYHFMQDVTSFNSDHLYCIHFCEDVVQGRDVRGWHLPAAPYLFPDMLLVLPCSALTTNFTAVFMLYELLYYGLLLTALMTVFRSIGLSWREAYTIGGFSIIFLLACYCDPAYVNRSFLMFQPANHMGCLLAGLAALAYVLRAVRNGYGWLSAGIFVIFCILSGFSDQLLIVQCFAPLGLVVVLLGLYRLIPLRRSLVTVLLLGVSTLLAVRMRGMIERLGFVPMRIVNLEHQSPTDVLAALGQFAGNLWNTVRNQPLMCAVFLLHLATLLTVIVMWFGQVRRSAATFQTTAASTNVSSAQARLHSTSILLLALVLLLAPVSNAGALLVTNNITEEAFHRYLYTWFLLPFLFLGLWLRLLPWRIVRLAPGAVIALMAFRLFTFPDRLSMDRFTHRYPPLAQALDDMVRKHGRLRGFGHYWRAREMHYLTREHVDVLPILSWGEPWFHCFNPNSFLLDDRRDLTIPDYHFFIVPNSGEPGPDAEHIRLRYGKPAEIIAVDGYEIWRYDRLVSRQLDLFLRAQLAQRLVEQMPYTGPSEPRTLAVPKRNFTPWRARGNVQIPREGTLVIRFDKPAVGAMIDIAANSADEYILWFFRAGQKLGKVHVSSVDWNGAEIAYCEPGVQARLVAVPPACRDGGFDEVRVTPVRRSPHFAIGHFLVFDEWVPYRSGGSSPIENYHRFEGEKMTHMDSTEVATIADASASAGRASQAAAAFQGYLAYGPYVPLPPGRYRVDFAVKVADNTTSDIVSTLDISAFIGQKCLQVRPLRGRDFPSTGQYQVFNLTFDADEELEGVEYRVHVAGKTKVTLDYIDVTRLTAEKTAEACEP